MPGGLRIAACTTWSEIRDAALPPACDALRAAAAEVGGRQIQNAGTIGGNLCNASPAADGVPPLLALDAAVELASAAGTRRLPLAAFLLGPRRTDRRPGEILTAVLLPEAALAGRSVFLKLGARRHLVISIAMVAVRLDVAGRPGRRRRARRRRLRPGGDPPARGRGGARSARPPTPRSPSASTPPRSPRPSPRSTTSAPTPRYRADGRRRAASRRARAGPRGMKLDRPGLGFRLNGRAVAFDVAPTRRLSDVLREEAGLTGTKVGCDAGDCGACTVLLDGRAVCACLTPAGRAAGREVTTVEGLAGRPEHRRLQESFLRHGAAQCGICTPGMLMAASELLARSPAPTPAEVEDGARRRPLPLHRLPQDHRRRLRRRRRRRPGPRAGRRRRGRRPPAPARRPRRRSKAATPSAPTSGPRAACSSRPCARRTPAPASASATLAGWAAARPGVAAVLDRRRRPRPQRLRRHPPLPRPAGVRRGRGPLPRRGGRAGRLRARRASRISTASRSPGSRCRRTPTPRPPHAPARTSSTPTARATC